MKLFWLALAWTSTWLTLVPQTVASPLKSNVSPNDKLSTTPQDASSLNAPPAIDPDFSIEPDFGTDTLKSVQVYASVLQAVREIALQDAYNGRAPESDYQYPQSPEVTIHIRGWPATSCYRRYALWALAQSIATMSDRPPFRNVKFNFFMKQRKVGVLSYRGPNTPQLSTNASGISIASEASGPSASNSAVLPNYLVSRQDTQDPTLSTLSPPIANITFADTRPGQLQIYPVSRQSPVDIRAYNLAAIGGIVFLARNKMNNPCPAVNVNVNGYGAAVLIEAPTTPTDPPLRNVDVVNALDILVRKAFEDRRFEETVAEVGWRLRDTLTIMGRVWVYNKPDQGRLGVPIVPEVSLELGGSAVATSSENGTHDD